DVMTSASASTSRSCAGRTIGGASGAAWATRRRLGPSGDASRGPPGRRAAPPWPPVPSAPPARRDHAPPPQPGPPPPRLPLPAPPSRGAPVPRLEPGRPAPEFALESDAGTTERLTDLRGQTVVLYFYPKDDTSGCTVEACEFRDLVPEYDARGARVIGVSPDPV